jgi:DNA-binding CsgD family transcriptional regulator
MAGPSDSDSREDKVKLELLEALGSSLDVRLVLERVYPLLVQLVPADYGALGVSASGKPEDFEWIVAKMPKAFFAAYPEMAGHDFVRQSVAKQPNIVLRDSDMVERSTLESNVMYRRAREVGAPLEQVMAVMLHIDDRWQSGLSLYRERRRPFSEREQRTLQQLTPAISNAVRNCHLFGAAMGWSAALETLLHAHGAATIIASANGTEIARSDGAAGLLEKWFAPHERRADRLPQVLSALLGRVESETSADGPPVVWRRRSADTTLEVSILPLAGYGRLSRWVLELRELSHSLCVPAKWALLLTGREQQVVASVLRGWDNRLVAAELGCTEATVKKHLQRVFDKLGVESRTALLVRAAEQTPE